MSSYAWIVILAIALFNALPLVKKRNRTKERIRRAIFVLLVLLAIIIAVLFIGINVLVSIILGVLVLVLFDKKTYTKKRLLIYGFTLLVIILVIVVLSSLLSRENPDYVLKHLQNNPETTTLYVAVNGEEIIGYQSEVVRPLASTVKIIVAIEYAMQIKDRQLEKDQMVPLDHLDRYYFKRTDGGAHEAWLEDMKESGKLKNNQVSLHEVAKGMMLYSSNANTDYLMDLLGVDNINQRIDELGLKQHEEVYPIVGAFLIPSYLKKEHENELSDKQLINELNDMPMDKYRTLAEEISTQLKEGTIDFEDATNVSLKVQKVWSDRLTGSSASEYGELLAAISRDEFPEVLRELLEWPMELWEENRKSYAHFGAKGGSTVFVLTQVIYLEFHDGQKGEAVILTDDLSIWEVMRMGGNIDSFIVKVLEDKEYREEVQRRLVES